jgi:hypothetical protein
MGQYNQDYFKVAGTAIENRDVAAQSKATLSAQAAGLRQYTGGPVPASSQGSRGERSPRRHGKKRRTRQKRHEIRVDRELASHPDESPAAAAYAVRTDHPPADVIDVKEGARRRAARQGAGTSEPAHSPTGEAPSWWLKGSRRAIRVLAEVIQRTSDMLALPGTVLRILRDIRQRREA